VITVLLGGIGVFLVGMSLLSDGLRSTAGSGFRQGLQRFARTPFRALLSGAGFTALVQSSSATTLTTIGFVSAGLLTFPQAVGLIFGANLGTTSTGWLVSLLGFKVDVGAVALPLVGIGALSRFVAPGRWRHAGTALAGFGLIFVGIDILQGGMASVAERIRPEDLYGTSLFGRIVLVVVGIVMTVVMQSSSAAVATTLAAIHAGGIDVHQGAYLVIGQNLGTSVKAILASIGGSIPVRRTALAHVLFNAVTGVAGLLTLPLLVAGALRLTSGDPTVALALFHTSFNLLGVLLLFPVVTQFASLVERIVPEHRPSLTRNLDRSVAKTSEVALEAARGSVTGVARILSDELARRLDAAAVGGREDRGPPSPRIGEVAPALAEIRDFLGRVQTHPDEGDGFEEHLTLLHAVEHLERMEQIRDHFSELGASPTMLAPMARQLAEGLRQGDLTQLTPAGAEVARVQSETFAGIRKAERSRVLEETATGEISPDEARVRILHVQRMDRIAYHYWRLCWHLARDGEGS